MMVGRVRAAVLLAIFSWAALAGAGGSSGGQAAKDAESSKKVAEDAAQQAADAVSTCEEGAHDDAAKMACRTGDAAKAALAAATGKSASDIRETDLQIALKSNAEKKLVTMMEGCAPPCNKGEAMKQALASAWGKGSGEVKDSDVRKFVEEGSNGQALAALNNCSLPNKALCFQAAKAAKAAASGKDASQISDDQFEKDILTAIDRDIADLLAANNNSSACWQIVAHAMQSGYIDGRVPTDYEISSELQKAAMIITGNIIASCGSNMTVCLADTRAALANALCNPDVSDAEVKEYIKKAAKDIYQESIKACVAAKQANSSATCDDARGFYNDLLSNVGGASNPKAEQLAQLSANVDLGKDFAKDNMKVCYSKGSKAEVGACMASFDGETEGVLRAGNPNLPASKQAALKLRNQEQATVEVLGDNFQACMSAAIASKNDTAKQICQEELQRLHNVAGVNESADNVIKKFRGSVFSEAAKGCDPADRAACVGAARDKLVAAGLQPREFGLVKRQAAMKSGAQAWADCMLGANSTNGTNVTCDDLAKTAWLLVMGATENSFTPEIADLIRRLGQALGSGDTTEIRFTGGFILALTTNSTNCSASEEAAFLDYFSPLVITYFNNSSTLASKGCQLVDGVAEYEAGGNCSLPQNSTDNITEQILAGAAAFRRLRRRLAGAPRGAITAGAAVQECPSSDPNCGSTSGTASASVSGGATTDAPPADNNSSNSSGSGSGSSSSGGAGAPNEKKPTDSSSNSSNSSNSSSSNSSSSGAGAPHEQKPPDSSSSSSGPPRENKPEDARAEDAQAGKSAEASKTHAEEGAALVANTLSACMDNANTDAAKMDCRTGTAAKAALAAALGKSTISDTDVTLALNSNAKKEVATLLESCGVHCDKGTALKEILARAQGRGSSEVSDSDVQQFVQAGSNDKALAALKNCSLPVKSQCLQVAKEAKAAASGRSASDISDNQFEKDIRSANDRDIANLLAVNNNSSACRYIVAYAMQTGDMDGRVPTDYEISSELEKAALLITGDIITSCGSNMTECAAQIKAALANALCSSNINDAVVKEYILNAAKVVYQQSITACAAAKRANSSATCDDPHGSYNNWLSNFGSSGNLKAQQLALLGAKFDVGKEFAKENMKVCYSKSSKADVDACMASFNNDTEGVLKASNPNLPASKQAALKLRNQEQASIEVLGDSFQACMSAAIVANNDTAKRICKDDLQKMHEVSGVNESADNVIQKFRGSVFSEAAKACDPAHRADCVQAARAELVAAGLPTPQFGLVKRQAAMKSAAQTWADCMLSGNGTNATCNDLAKTAWLLVSGSNESNFTLDIADLIRKLGQALEDGDTTEMRFTGRFIIARATNSTNCSESEEAEFMSYFSPLVMRHFNNSSVLVSKGCLLVEEVAEYQGEGTVPAEYNQTSTEADIAAIVANAPANGTIDGSAPSRRLGRRLAAMGGDLTAGAAVQECPSSDPTCGQAITSTSDSTSSTTSTTSTSSTNGTNLPPTSTTKPPNVSGASGIMVSLALLLGLLAIV